MAAVAAIALSGGPPWPGTPSDSPPAGSAAGRTGPDGAVAALDAERRRQLADAAASRRERRTPPPSTPPPPAPPKRPARPTPVAGLTQRQMDHAAVIVAAGRARKMPPRAMVVAIMTAMQETNLRNLANPGVPASLGYRHDGVGTDHDSVGVFQQRPSQGWGTVAQLMNPRYAADVFYARLAKVGGWQALPLTAAAQAVQRSAYPDAYAKHEARARKIVDSLT